jgi:hypothetical protein
MKCGQCEHWEAYKTSEIGYCNQFNQTLGSDREACAPAKEARDLRRENTILKQKLSSILYINNKGEVNRA